MKQRGMVLMAVLWIVLVVAFISFALAAAVRSELAAAGNSFDSERALFMAKSAAEVTERFPILSPISFRYLYTMPDRQFEWMNDSMPSLPRAVRIDVSGDILVIPMVSKP